MELVLLDHSHLLMLQKGFVLKDYFFYNWPLSFVNASECTGFWTGVVLLFSALFLRFGLILMADYILTQSLYHRSLFLLFLSTYFASVVSVAMILIEKWYWKSRKDNAYHQFMVSTAQKWRSKYHVMRQFSADHNIGNVEHSCTTPMHFQWERESGCLQMFPCLLYRQPLICSWQHSLLGVLLLLHGLGTAAHKKSQLAHCCRYLYASLPQDYKS